MNGNLIDLSKAYNKSYYIKNKEEINKKGKARYERNKEDIKTKCNLYRAHNKLKCKELYKSYYQKHKDFINNRIKQDRKRFPEKYRESNRIYANKRRKRDPMYRLQAAIRYSVWKALKHFNIEKQYSTEQYAGCSLIKLKEYIEKQFRPGMNWENYGKFGWHVDHKIPLSRIDEFGIQTVTHFTNLQPMWATENRKKSDKLI